ncbi:MAG: KH domain-containing protein [SAR202 cluster bacterium]|nr:RNA-binding protein [Chloroflexota bacterium]MQG23223.1 KH domain-containing protein [SAR202 cluster bacterium]
MKELVEYIAKAITTNPDDVVVEQDSDEEGRIVLTLKVHPDDKGRVIGKQGRIAQSMRSLLRVAAVKEGVHITLDIE